VPRLTKGDQRLYRALCVAAREGDPCPSTDDIQEFLGKESTSTPAASLNRIEQAGLIKVIRYQKGRRVLIVETGQITASPANPRPHWRDRPLGKAAGAVGLAEIAHPGAADLIRALSTEFQLPLDVVVAELMLRGLQSIQRVDQLA
jgi:hypothetical protein